MGDYTKVGARWPPPSLHSCCLLLPTLRCINRHGEDGELHDEPMLIERDLSWLTAEAAQEAGAAAGRGDASSNATLRPAGRRLSLAALEEHHAARTLVLDLRSQDDAVRASAVSAWLDQSGTDRVQWEDPLALLPHPAEVHAVMRRRLARRTDGRHVRQCIERLLTIAAETATQGEILALQKARGIPLPTRRATPPAPSRRKRPAPRLRATSHSA